MNQGPTSQVKKLTSVASHIEAEMIMSLLEENGIESFVIDKESGNYMRIYMGYSVYGEDIYVGEKDWDGAKELLDAMDGPEQWEAQDEPGEGGEGEIEAEEVIYAKPRKTARIILICLLIVWVPAGLAWLVGFFRYLF